MSIAIHSWLGRVGEDKEESIAVGGRGWAVGIVCNIGLCALPLLFACSSLRSYVWQAS
jgi:hypothetical protein